MLLTLADGRRERGDVLIGADGLGSAIRRALHPGDPPPRDSGLCAVRGVVRGVTAHLGGLSGAVYLGRGCEAAMVQAGGDAIYWFVSVRASTVRVRDIRRAVDRAGAAGAAAAVVPRRRGRRRRRTICATTRSSIAIRSPRGATGRSRCSATRRIRCCRRRGRARRRRSRTPWPSARRSPHPAPAPTALRAYERVRAARTAAIVRRGRRLAAAVAMDGALVDWLRASVIRATPARLLAAAMLRV